MNRLNILVADDDAQSREMMEFILRSSKHVVKFASNGVETVQMVKSGAFDLILMDVQMPFMDGLEAAHQIREWENGETHLVIIGLTAVMDSEHGKCLQAGMDGIISKPFDTGELLEAIAAYAAGKKTTSKKTPPPESAVTPVLDARGAVQRFAGDREKYISLLDEFILSLSGRFEELVHDYESGLWRSLSDHAHNLKGLSANFGAMELSRKALELDQCVDEKLYDLAGQKINEIDACIQTLRSEAFAFLRKTSVE
jgi:two-component system, sensor histidine kinase and response regulator